RARSPSGAAGSGGGPEATPACRPRCACCCPSAGWRSSSSSSCSCAASPRACAAPRATTRGPARRTADPPAGSPPQHHLSRGPGRSSRSGSRCCHVVFGGRHVARSRRSSFVEPCTYRLMSARLNEALVRRSAATSSRYEAQQAIVVGTGLAAAIGVVRRDHQRTIGGAGDVAQPAVLARRELFGCREVIEGDLVQALAAQPGDDDGLIGDGHAAGAGLARRPLLHGVGEVVRTLVCAATLVCCVAFACRAVRRAVTLVRRAIVPVLG